MACFENDFESGQDDMTF